MPEKHLPLRMCVVSREMYPKQELIRLVKQGNQLIIDATQKMSGRGFWIHKDSDTIKLAQKRKIFNRVLHSEVTEQFYIDLEKVVNE